MIIDPSTDVGKLRLRVSDFGDIAFLPDQVYVQTLEDCNGNLPKAAKTLAMYILGMLAFKTRRKMAQLEVYSNEQFEQYKQYLMLSVSNPNFMDISPIPYSASAESNPLVDFQKTWNRNFYSGTSDQSANHTAALSPNDGSKFGPFGGC